MNKSKRQLAALRGWRTRRAEFKRRSDAAKRGWVTRRKNERKRKRKRKKREITPTPILITRRQYKNEKTGKVTHVEIRSRAGQILSIQVETNVYTNQKDFEQLGPLLAALPK